MSLEPEADQPSPELRITPDDLSRAEVTALVREHLEDMSLSSPPESMHALSLDELKRPDISFWSVWQGSELVGFGALKHLDPEHAEIKSMRTAGAHRGRGIAKRLLDYMLDEARRRGYRRVSLETGSHKVFEPARRLYAGSGFIVCGPFADYIDDPNSVYMTRGI